MIVSDFTENVCVIFQHVHKWKENKKNPAAGKKFPDVSWNSSTWWNGSQNSPFKWLPAPLLLLHLILAARSQSFDTRRVESSKCASMGFWRKAGSESKARPSTQGPCQSFPPGNSWIPSRSISRCDFNHVPAFSQQATLKYGPWMEWLLSGSLQSGGYQDIYCPGNYDFEMLKRQMLRRIKQVEESQKCLLEKKLTQR